MNPSIVLGYHGCSADTADKVLTSRKGVHLKTSVSPSEWLGDGVKVAGKKSMAVNLA